MIALACMSLQAAAYQLPPTFRSPHFAIRGPGPRLGFFDDMRKGFDAASFSSASRSNSDENGECTDNAPNVLLDKLATAFREPTAEEKLASRKAAGEGVVWSADYTRAWRSTKGMPQGEISLEEAKRIALELSIPMPAEVVD